MIKSSIKTRLTFLNSLLRLFSLAKGFFLLADVNVGAEMLLILNVLVSGLDEFGAGEHVGFHEARRLLDRLGSKDSLLHSAV